MTSPEQRSVRGLHGERTTLSWARTALCIFGVGALMAGHAGGAVIRGVLLGSVLATAPAMVVYGDRRYRRRSGRSVHDRAAPVLAAAATTGFTVVLAVFGVIGVTA